MTRDEARRGQSRLALRIALLVSASLVGFAVAEFGARWWLPAPQIVRVARVDHASRREAEGANGVVARVPRHPEQAAGRLYVPTLTGRRLRANARVTIDAHSLSGRRIEIRTNSLGYRNRELGRKAGPRILFLGDSITFGDYVHEGETFVRRIEARARRDGHAWETINAGVGGASLDNEMAILLETGLATDPDLVVLDFYLNDFQASPGVSVVELPWPLDQSAFLHHAAHALAATWATLRIRLGGPYVEGIDFDAWTVALEEQWEASGPGADALRRSAVETIYDWGGAFSPLAWQRLRPRLRELAALADEHGFRLVVVAFPVRDQVEAKGLHDAPQRELGRELRALGVPYLDLLPAMRAAHRSDPRPIYYDHCHPTPLGNDIVADAIYAFLVEQEASAPPGR